MMTPEQEQLLKDIHSSLVGPLGVKENGLIYQVTDHGKRISSLERWKWWVAGGAAVLVFLLRLAAMAVGK